MTDNGEFWIVGYWTFGNFIADSRNPNNPFPAETPHWNGFEIARSDWFNGGLVKQPQINTIGG